MSAVRIKPGRNLFAALSLLAVDVLVFGMTNAGKTTSFMLIAGFLLLVATVYFIITGVLNLAKFYGFPLKHKRSLAASAAGLVACLVALQSVGELNARDELVLLPLIVIGYAYRYYGAGLGGTDD